MHPTPTLGASSVSSTRDDDAKVDALLAEITQRSPPPDGLQLFTALFDLWNKPGIGPALYAFLTTCLDSDLTAAIITGLRSIPSYASLGPRYNHFLLMEAHGIGFQDPHMTAAYDRLCLELSKHDSHIWQLNGIARIPLVLQLILPTVGQARSSPAAIVRSSFAVAFKGPAVHMLMSCIRSYSITQPNHTENPYTKVLPIIQSSGFGKSKMCVHLSFVQPGMLMCTRNPTTRRPIPSFPPRDHAVYNYFETCCQKYVGDSNWAINMTHASVAFFLTAYCAELHRIITHLMHFSGCFVSTATRTTRPTSDSASDDAPKPTVKRGHNASSCWNTVVHFLALSLHKKHDFVPTLRVDQSPDLCHRSQLQKPEHWPASPEASMYASFSTTGAASGATQDDTAIVLSQLRHRQARTKMLDRICKQANDHLATYTTSHSARAEKECVRTYLRPGVERMESLVPDELAQHTFFFLALDELGYFAPSMLPFLRRVWRLARPQRSWILFLDTNTRMVPVATPASAPPTRSHRNAEREPHVVHPFIVVPRDINFTEEEASKLDADILNHRCTMRQLNETIPLFGRPLWNDHIYRSGSTIVGPMLISQKLLAPREWLWPTYVDEPVARGRLNDEIQDTKSNTFGNIMALVSQSLSLDTLWYPPNQSWQDYTADQVDQHLRYLCAYKDELNLFISRVPSEPALSVAAAWSFRFPPKGIAPKWSLGIQTLAVARTAFGLNVGQEAEEGARLLCSMATDFALGARLSRTTSSGDDYEWTMGLVTIHDWLQQLLGRIEGSDASEFDEWAKRQWINFKHLVELPDQIWPNTAISRRLLEKIWMRHAAVRGAPSEEGWALLIPMYEAEHVPVDRQVYSPGRLSYVVFQIRDYEAKPAVPDQIGPPLGEWQATNEDESRRDTLELFLDLRGTPSTPHTVELQPDRPGYGRRFCIVLSGLDSTVFPMLAQLSTRANTVLPTLFGLPRVGEYDHRSELTYFVRNSDAKGQELFELRQEIKSGRPKMYDDLIPLTAFDGEPERGEDTKRDTAAVAGTASSARPRPSSSGSTSRPRKSTRFE